jgi:predicted ArsR family transcriptional regulator
MGESDRRQRVVDALTDNPHGLSVTELVGLIGSSDSQVRRTLMALTAAGAMMTVRDAPSRSGRPPQRFRLAQSPTGWPALNQMLVALQARMGPAEPSIVREVGREYGAALTSRDSANNVIKTMADFGFSPRDISSPRDTRAHTQRLCLQTCAFRDAAVCDGGQVVCVLCRGLIEGIGIAFGGDAKLVEVRGPVIGGCQVQVQRSGPESAADAG